MQLVIIVLLVVALALLVLGLIGVSSALVVGSILVSLVAVAMIVRARRRRQARLAVESAEAARQAKMAADRDETTRVLAAAAAAASRSAAAQPAVADPAIAEDWDEDEPAVADTIAPLTVHGGDPVWVIDGRPRYHAQGCEFLSDRGPESVPLSQAVEDGFTPCALCDPDRALAGQELGPSAVSPAD